MRHPVAQGAPCVCALSTLTLTSLSSSSSLSHIYFACYTPRASFYGQRDVVAVLSSLPLLFVLCSCTFIAPCVALFNTLWQHLSSLLFGIVDPAQKTKQRKKYEEEVEKKESTNILLYIWLRISFLSFRFVCFCLLFALFKHFYGRTKNARNVSVTFMMWQCYLTNPADTCTVVILSLSHTSHKSPSLLGYPLLWVLSMTHTNCLHFGYFYAARLVCLFEFLWERESLLELFLLKYDWVRFNWWLDWCITLHPIRVRCVSF